MERLTCLKTPARWDSGRHPTKYTSRSTFPEVVKRLAYYEDAEQDGRLVVLPCKVGDTLYSATCGKMRPFVVAGFELYGTALYVVEQVGLGREYRVYGKTAFLTKEEAEAALKGSAE